MNSMYMHMYMYLQVYIHVNMYLDTWHHLHAAQRLPHKYTSSFSSLLNSAGKCHCTDCWSRGWQLEMRGVEGWRGGGGRGERRWEGRRGEERRKNIFVEIWRQEGQANNWIFYQHYIKQD